MNIPVLEKKNSDSLTIRFSSGKRNSWNGMEKNGNISNVR